VDPRRGVGRRAHLDLRRQGRRAAPRRPATGARRGRAALPPEAPSCPPADGAACCVPRWSSSTADAPWVDVDRIISEVLDPGTHPSRRAPVLPQRRGHRRRRAGRRRGVGLLLPRQTCSSPARRSRWASTGRRTTTPRCWSRLRVHDRFATVIGAMEKPDGARDWEVDREFFDGLVASAFASTGWSGSTPTSRTSSPTSTSGSAEYVPGSRCRRARRTRSAGTCVVGCSSTPKPPSALVAAIQRRLGEPRRQRV
jgi:hypothetical protein